MTPENRRLLTTESGATVDWDPDTGEAELGGNPEQVNRAKRLLTRVLTHCHWGCHDAKVKRLLQPYSVDTVLCRLSPTNMLRPAEKLMSAANPTLSVGKGGTNDVVIEDALVSRQHCILELDGERGAVYILDLSTNGTFLNGIRLPSKGQGKVLLSHGDEILLKDPATGVTEFGYIVNLNELQIRVKETLEPTRRKLSAEDHRDLRMVRA